MGKKSRDNKPKKKQKARGAGFALLEEKSRSRLEAMVMARLADGWALNGGPLVVETSRGMRYYQSLTR